MLPSVPAWRRNAERREITLLVVDLAVPTMFTERSEPTALAAVLGEHLSVVIAIGTIWGGTVDGCAGGRTSIIFGAPQPHAQGDLAGFAVEAAFEIHARIRALSAIPRWHDVPLGWQTKIAIATGLCIVGTFVCDAAHIYTAIGSAAEVASSLQASAAPGTIVCDRTTWLLVNDYALGRALEPMFSAAGRDSTERYEISGFVARDRPWLAKALAARQTTTEVTSGRLIRREGDYWTIICNGLPLHFKDSKGFRCLVRLLAEPHVEVHVLELAGVIADSETARSKAVPAAFGTAPLRAGGVEAILDHRAKAEYRSRLHELDREIEEANSCADAGRAARAEQEKCSLTCELASALGLQGRDRTLPSHSERARVNVTRTIRATIKNIAKSNPELGGHLRASVRTGTFCSYSPHPGMPDRWHIG